MLLKKINLLRCTFTLVFVVPQMLISSPANARLAVADGEYAAWEESIIVKSGKVVSCVGWIFDHYEGEPSVKNCNKWKFTTSNRNVVKATSRSKSTDVYYFCRSQPSKPSSHTSCGQNGWQKPREVKAP